LALYQGTTLVVPHMASHELGFSPFEIVIEVRNSAGAKAQIRSGLYGTTKVVP
jgi:hypothetical protein